MAGLASLSKAREVFERWFVGGGEPGDEAHEQAGKVSAPETRATADERIRSFMNDVKASSQDWLGRVRLINFDDIRERIGPTWPKLQEKVELLAEKVIRETLSDRDLYLNMGAADFLVFIADVSPEEVRIRCLAIVEVIHEKLFGVGDEIGEGPGRFAECHVAQTGSMPLEWELDPAGDGSQTPGDAVRRLFRPDAEILDEADIAASAQAAIDAIIAHASQSENVAGLGPLFERLQHLSHDLKLLEPSLLAHRSRPQNRSGHDQPQVDVATNDWVGDGGSPQLKMVWDDIGTLVSLRDGCTGHSHPDFLAALKEIQIARSERIKLWSGDEAGSVHRLIPGACEPPSFDYVPVCRFVSQGERIYRGIYRVTPKQGALPVTREPDAEPGESAHQNAAAAERLVLQHALGHVGMSAGTRFMLMASVHVETLRRPNSQRRYSTILRAAQLAAKRRLIIEITGYCETDNTIGVRRAIEELRAHCQAIFVSMPGDVVNVHQVAAECKKAGGLVLGLDVTHLNASNPEMLRMLKAFAAFGAQYAIPTYINGIASLPMLASAVASGVTYICAPALIPSRPEPWGVKRLTLNDLYTPI